MIILIGSSVILIVLSLILLCYVFALKKQMRRMAEELQLNKEISYNKQLVISLFDRDLTELATEVNKSLEFQKNLKFEAEKSQRQLKQSVSDIAHDLRTPITVIKGNLQRLSEEKELTEKSKRYVNICREKTDTLGQMVDDFFELSYWESELTKVDLEKIDLTGFAVQFFVDHEAIIREKGINPQIQLPEKSIFVEADRQLLSRIFGNLLSNIMKHSKDNFSFELQNNEGEIKCRFKNEIDTICSGQELPDVEHLFERTYRGDRARTGGGPGGLGLYIVKLLTEKQGARVTAYCELKENITQLVIEIIWDID